MRDNDFEMEGLLAPLVVDARSRDQSPATCSLCVCARCRSGTVPAGVEFYCLCGCKREVARLRRVGLAQVVCKVVLLRAERLRGG